MVDERTDAEIKAFNLHVELQALLYSYNYLVRVTNSEPTFGEDVSAVRAGRALYDNMPLADWEPPQPVVAVGGSSNG
jgi:hypothetical protein